MTKSLLLLCIAFFAVIFVSAQQNQQPLCSPMHGYVSFVIMINNKLNQRLELLEILGEDLLF